MKDPTFCRKSHPALVPPTTWLPSWTVMKIMLHPGTVSAYSLYIMISLENCLDKHAFLYHLSLFALLCNWHTKYNYRGFNITVWHMDPTLNFASGLMVTCIDVGLCYMYVHSLAKWFHGIVIVCIPQNDYMRLYLRKATFHVQLWIFSCTLFEVLYLLIGKENRCLHEICHDSIAIYNLSIHQLLSG